MSKAKYALVYLIATLDFAQRSVHANKVSNDTDKTMKGGMQSERIDNLYCTCGKTTGRKLISSEKEICLHFSKSGAYWHITENGKTKRTFTQPKEFQD